MNLRVHASLTMTTGGADALSAAVKSRPRVIGRRIVLKYSGATRENPTRRESVLSPAE